MDGAHATPQVSARPYDAEAARRVLLVGPPPLTIDEGASAAHACNQALRALKAAGRRVAVLSPSQRLCPLAGDLADATYVAPITAEGLRSIILREKPEAIMVQHGGHAALRSALDLLDEGFFAQQNVMILGTPLEIVRRCTHRSLLYDDLRALHIDVPRSFSCASWEEIAKAADAITFPVSLYGTFLAGEKAAALATDSHSLKQAANRLLALSPTVLAEEALNTWKRCEAIALRDTTGAIQIACLLESVDPADISFDDATLVSPPLSLSDAQRMECEAVARSAVEGLGIVGMAAIRLAVDPSDQAVRVLRVSPHSTITTLLAARITGRDFASIATMIAMGSSLSVFQPSGSSSLAVRVPQWESSRFALASDELSLEKRSSGQALAFGSSFEDALQQAFAMLSIGHGSLYPVPFTFDQLTRDVKRPSPRRLFAIASALQQGWSADEVRIASGIDAVFIKALGRCAAIAQQLFHGRASQLPADLLKTAKLAGFSDEAIGALFNVPEEQVLRLRNEYGIRPVLAPLQSVTATPAYRLSYKDAEGFTSSEELALLPGAGPHRIGCSAECDWHCVETLIASEHGRKHVVLIDCNPDALAQDDMGATLVILAPVRDETLDAVTTHLRCAGILASNGAESATELALRHPELPLLGTPRHSLEQAEHKQKFSALLDSLHLPQPAWREASDASSAASFAATAGYPVVISPCNPAADRPSMIAWSDEALNAYVEATPKHALPLHLSTFEHDAKRIELTGIAQHGKLLFYVVSEYIEHSGVHAGDSVQIVPPQRVTLETLRAMRRTTNVLVEALELSGAFTISFVAKENRLGVLSCHPHLTRSVPFLSVATGVPIARLAFQAQLGIAPTNTQYQTLDLDHVAVRAPVWSFDSLPGADPRQSLQMASTGEAMGIGDSAHEALLLALRGARFLPPTKNVLLSIGRLEDKLELLPSIQALHARGLSLFATQNTHEFLKSRSIPSVQLYKISEPRSPNIREYLDTRRIELVIDIASHASAGETDGYQTRRLAADRGIPLLTEAALVRRVVEALGHTASNDPALAASLQDARPI